MDGNVEKRIGVFDSGVGGLTVLKELVKIMPYENFYYFGDTANVPYGIKTSEEIAELSVNAYRKLEELGIKLLVIGCNTATVHGLEAIEKVANVPVIGVIKPGVLSAKKHGCDKIIILATEATINSCVIQKLLKKNNKDILVQGIGAPDMVMAVESGNSRNEKGREIVYRYLDKGEFDPNGVMLCCTHFPALEHFIRDYYQEKDVDVTIIDPAEMVSKIAVAKLEEMGKLNKGDEKGKITYYTSGDKTRFKESGNMVLDGDLIISEVNNL